MNRFLAIGKFFQYYLPVTLTLFMLVTIERTVITDGGNDRLYGLPLPWITNSFAFSFHYNVYVLPMLLNLLFFFILTVALFKLIEFAGLRLKTHWAAGIIAVLVSLFWLIIFILTVNESSFYLTNKLPYKTTGYKLTLGGRL